MPNKPNVITIRLDTTSRRPGFQPPDPDIQTYTTYRDAAGGMLAQRLTVPMQALGEERGMGPNMRRWGRTEQGITTIATVVDGDYRAFDEAMWRVADLLPLGRRVDEARRAWELVMDQAREFGMLAIDAGRPEAQTARELNVDRMTVRKWNGKPR